MTDITPRRRDKAVSSEMGRIRLAFPFIVGDPARERIGRRLALLSVGLREIRREVASQGGAGRASPKLVVELRQYASEVAAHEDQLCRSVLERTPPDPMAMFAAARQRMLDAGKARRAPDAPGTEAVVRHSDA